MPVDRAGLQADLVRRLRCAEGHVRGIAAMVERGEDCDSIVRQTLAVQAALHEINRLALKHHLTVCVREQWQDGYVAREQCVAEITSLYEVIGGSVPLTNEKEEV